MKILNIDELMKAKGVCAEVYNICLGTNVQADDLSVENEEINESMVIFQKGKAEDITFVRVFDDGKWVVWIENDRCDKEPEISNRVDAILKDADIWDKEFVSFIDGLRSYLDGFVDTKNPNIPSVIVEIEEVIS